MTTKHTPGAIRPESEKPPVFSAAACAEALVHAHHPLAAEPDAEVCMPRHKLVQLLDLAAREGVDAVVKASDLSGLVDDVHYDLLGKAAAVLGVLSVVDERGCDLDQCDVVRTATVVWRYVTCAQIIICRATDQIEAVVEANRPRGAA